MRQFITREVIGVHYNEEIMIIDQWSSKWHSSWTWLNCFRLWSLHWSWNLQVHLNSFCYGPLLYCKFCFGCTWHLCNVNNQLLSAMSFSHPNSQFIILFVWCEICKHVWLSSCLIQSNTTWPSIKHHSNLHSPLSFLRCKISFQVRVHQFTQIVTCPRNCVQLVDTCDLILSIKHSSWTRQCLSMCQHSHTRLVKMDNSQAYKCKCKRSYWHPNCSYAILQTNERL